MPRRPMPPRIGFNAALFSPSRDFRAAGIHGHIAALVAALCERDDVRVVPFVAGDGAVSAARRLWPRAEVRRAPRSAARPLGRIAWEQLVLPAALARARVDLLHAPAHAMPLASPVPAVVTVHDLSFFRLPGAFPGAQGAYLRAATRVAVRRAAALIAVSDFTRRELVDVLGADPARTYVVPNGADPACRPRAAEAVAAYRRRAGLPARFILTVGTLQPRKNLGVLLDAYARLRARDLGAPDLVIAGAPGWGDADPARRAAALGVAEHVHVTGYVPADDLPLLYNAAEIFAYPSRYEGFGLPVVEAMASGTPVVAARATSLPEVVGPAGVTVPPDDAEGWAAALGALAGDPVRRAALAAAGRERAARFDWRETARLTAEVYGRVRRGRARRPARAVIEA